MPSGDIGRDPRIGNRASTAEQIVANPSPGKCSGCRPDSDSVVPAVAGRILQRRAYAFLKTASCGGAIVFRRCGLNLPEIVKRASVGDLVITADIPLAAEVIAKGGEALNPRGERYSPDTIRGVLAMRDFMDTMRSSGVVGGGPPPLTQANRNAFASQLDTWLAKRALP